MAKKASTRKWRGLRLVAAGLSATTSGVGLWVIFQSGVDPLVAIAFAALFTIVLQITILMLWDASFMDLGKLARLLAVGAAILFATVSGLLASGSYSVLFNKAAIEEFRTDGEIAGLEIPVLKQQGNFEQLAARLESFASLAKTKAVIEDRSGTSCFGTKAKTGKGPRWRLRQRNEVAAVQHAGRIRSLSDGLTEQVSALRTATDEGRYVTTYSAIRRLQNSSDVAEARNWVKSLTNGFSGLFVDPQSGKSFVCRDPESLATLKELSSMLSRTVALPARPPKIVTFTFHDALLKSYGDAGKLAGYWVGLSDLSDLDKEHIRHSYIGFGAGFLVEFLLFLFSFIAHRIRIRSGADYGSFEAYRNNGKVLSEEEVKTLFNGVYGRGRLDPILNLFIDLTYPVGREKFLLVPIGGRIDVRRQIMRLASLFRLKCGERRLRNWDISVLNPDFVEGRAHLLDEVTKVDLYKIPPTVEAEIERLIRDSAYSGPDDDSPQSDPDATEGGRFHVLQGGG